MPNLDRMAVCERIVGFDFGELFTQELGWDYPAGVACHTLTVGAEAFAAQVVAEKRGVRIFHVAPRADGSMPDYPLRRALDAEVTKLSFEHLNIFTDSRTQAQVWQYVARSPDRPAAFREYRYDAGHSYESLLQKLRAISFSLDDEEGLTLDGVTRPLRDAMDRDVVTKRFYERFREQQQAFQEFIQGIDTPENQRWYSSVMLNRLMFVWFIQKKGFLDGDTSYLAHRLRQVQEHWGGDQFHSFYRTFLLRLFHEGLGSPERTPELDQLLGRIPYLNGGIFQKHPIEEGCTDIQIPDQAFARVFAFFDDYDWHLDDRPISRTDGREISPDVLGCIFEKYINQKQMGAYYTKEDITGYISKNTIIPFLLERVRDSRPEAFAPDGPAWQRLRAEPDRYIYPAVRQGVDLELPPHIACGLKDVSQRGRWNERAAAKFALPTEIWRETVARRQRCAELRERLRDTTQPLEINDLITLNLDLRQVAQDLIEDCDSPEFLSAFWTALAGRGATEPGGLCHGITVLDPTCGSGAFLFAALNVLKPLYEACLQRMREFLEDWRAAGSDPHPNLRRRFELILKLVGEHPNPDYFILKTIILTNLFGVDIMDEAVEICKLRLFLKLAAQVEPDPGKPNLGVEPLPDIDFNIRAGNTLVGFASIEDVKRAMGDDLIKKLALPDIEERAAEADRAYGLFRQMQTEKGMDSEEFREAKSALRAKLRALEDELNRYLAEDYGVKLKRKGAYEQWLTSHKPFHWLVDFYGIMHQGGFDAIIGNPPYVEYGSLKGAYAIRGYRTLPCGDLYAFCTERAVDLLQSAGHVGLIVPISVFGTDGFRTLQQLTLDLLSPLWVSCFANRPSQLFDGAQKRLTVLVGRRANGSHVSVHTSQYLRWRREEFATLFAASVRYAPPYPIFSVFPASLEKLGDGLQVRAFSRLSAARDRLGHAVVDTSEHNVFYTRKFGYFLAFLDFIPQVVDCRTQERLAPSELKMLGLSSDDSVHAVVAALSSATFFWFWNVVSDCRNVNRRDLLAFPLNPDRLEPCMGRRLADLGTVYIARLKGTSQMMRKSGLTIETFDYAATKPILDEIDRVLARHYGFTDEELDFIINYDIKYRLGLGGTSVAVEDDAES